MAEAVGQSLPTIFALASGSGRGAIAVLRLTGALCGDILRALCGGPPPPRQASLRKLRDEDGDLLDQALVLWFPRPASFTGEDCAELHLHAGRAVIADVGDRLVQLGAKPAAPGEFTRRAFLNGKLDLVEAEGLADLIAAETAQQRRQALEQMDGALSRVYRAWAQRLRQIMAWQEALIDFSTEDLPAETETELLDEILRLQHEIGRHLDDAHRGERLRQGLTFVVAGRPNVGKSSIVNALVGRDVAIVAATAGTTRDAIEVAVEFGGIPVRLVDTAGLRPTEEAVEREGVRRAQAHIAHADLVISVRDATMAPEDDPAAASANVLRVANKTDLAEALPDEVGVSARTGVGIGALRDALCHQAMHLAASGTAPALTRTRHRSALTDAKVALDAAANAPFADLRGEELRLALRSVGRITGEVAVDDVLDTIFGQFCIGK
jgi:tRNA modification GTPase